MHPTTNYIHQFLLVAYIMWMRERVRERDLDERVASAVINFQYRSHVPTAITIIGCTKYSNHLLFLFQQRRLYQYTLTHNTKQESQKSVRMIITWAQLNPSITNWWALAINFRLFVWLNCSDISCEKNVNIKSEKIETTGKLKLQRVALLIDK